MFCVELHPNGCFLRLHLIEKLTEADISKETATELLEFVEQKQTNLVTKDHFGS